MLDSMSVYGDALRAYDNGDRNAVLQLLRDDGFVSEGRGPVRRWSRSSTLGRSGVLPQ